MNLSPGGKRAALVVLAATTALVAALAPATPVGLGAVVGFGALTLAWLVSLVAGGEVPVRLATYVLVAFMLGLAAYLAL
ncbi:MAG: hypothetical protein ABEJ06_06915 [Haloarculaceae archaeon]